MVSVKVIAELEFQLSEARDAAAQFLAECRTAIESKGLASHEVPSDLRPRTREKRGQE